VDSFTPNRLTPGDSASVPTGWVPQPVWTLWRITNRDEPPNSRVVLKSTTIPWDVPSCSLIEIYRCFGGKLSHQLLDGRISQATGTARHAEQSDSLQLTFQPIKSVLVSSRVRAQDRIKFSAKTSLYYCRSVGQFVLVSSTICGS
jgi:hypothetical protein